MSALIEYEIPTSWIWTRIGTISHVENEHIEPKETPNTEFNYLSIGNIESETGNLVKFKPTKGKEIASSKLKFTTKDILYSKLRPYLNKVHIPDFSGVSATDLIPLRPEGNISREYLAYYLRIPNIVEYLNSRVHGIQLPRVSVNDIFETPIPLIPLGEQKRIVSKIEDLSKESKIVHQTLEKIPEILKKFRRSVLASAFRGELISQDYGDEHAEKLLEKIRNERRKRWEDDIKTKGKNPKNFKYAEPEHVSQEEIDRIPHGWIWVTLDEISEKIVDGTHFTPKYTPDGIPFISVKDIRNETIYFDDCKYISEHDHKDLIKRCNPEFGDILITKSGTIGRIAVVKTRKEFSLFVSVALIKPLKKYVNSDFVALMLENYINNIDVEQEITGGVIKNFHIEDLKKVKIPLTTLEEQKRICKRFEEQLSLVHLIEKSVEEVKRRSDRIDQAILTKAFRGELVPQDPSDEPASVLLERIKQEKELEIKQTAKRNSRKSK